MKPIQKILIPVDFTEPSSKAVHYGVSLAKQFGAKVVLAHIVADPARATPDFPTESHALAHALYEAATKDIQKLIPQPDKLSVAIETVVRIGDISSDLLNIAQENTVDLVVMGTHGRRNPVRWFIGSVTERMLRQLPVPVLTVSHLKHEPGNIKNILYASDMSEQSLAGFRAAAEWAKVTGAKLTVIHVVHHLEYMWGATLNGYILAQGAAMVPLARKHLEEFVHREKPAGVEVDWMIVEGQPYEEVLRAAEQCQSDLIIMNLQSKSAVDRAFLGATAERVVRLSPIPVLSIPVSRT